MTTLRGLPGPGQPTREQIMRDYLGYAAETSPVPVQPNSTTMVSGTVYASAIALLAGEPITNIIAGLTTAAAGLTLARFGIYNAAATLKLAQTGDVTALVQGTAGRVPLPLALQSNGDIFRPSADGVYLVAGICVGTTGATLARGTGLNIDIVQGGGAPLCGSFAGQTDLPATLTLNTAGQPAIWFAVS